MPAALAWSLSVYYRTNQIMLPGVVLTLTRPLWRMVLCSGREIKCGCSRCLRVRVRCVLPGVRGEVCEG